MLMVACRTVDDKKHMCQHKLKHRNFIIILSEFQNTKIIWMVCIIDSVTHTQPPVTNNKQTPCDYHTCSSSCQSKYGINS
jgi:hypothetical protein